MGSLFKIPALIIYFVGGLWGFFVCVALIANNFGWIAAGIAIFIAPIALYLAPLYAGIAHDNWFPAILVFGSTAAAFVLYFVGSKLDGE